MRFRLRYLQHDLGLTEGEFAIGRSADCQLSLDDPMVSRRHAVLVVTKNGVTVEDMQSRNGVNVNGQRITGRERLRAGDKILIGSQELTLLLGPHAAERDRMSTTQAGRHTMPDLVVAKESPFQRMAQSATARPPPDQEPPAPSLDVATERRADAFNLLGGVADKALALGRAEEAERLLSSALIDIQEAIRASKQPPPALVDVAARFAAKLATGTAKGTWVDYVIELYDAQRRPCPALVIDELYNAMRKVSAIDLVALRAYVAHLREAQGTLGPAEKFLLQRIEGLERLAALR